MQTCNILNDLYKFYEFFVASRYRDFVSAEHIEELADELVALYLGFESRLVVNMPPRFSKSSLVTLAFPVWLLLRDPSLNVLIVNSADGLSQKFGLVIRDLLKQVSSKFGLDLADEKSSSTYMMLKRDGKLCSGSIRLVGAGGSITGTDADYLIIDDPYKGGDDILPSQLEKKIDWFNSIILQRLEPSSRLVICHTRWAENDLSGYLKVNSADEYKFIEMKAITDEGKSLWPERYSLEWLKKREAEITSRVFQALYQQQPFDRKGQFFAVEHFKDASELPSSLQLLRTVFSWDIASSQAGDFTVGVRMKVLGKMEEFE